MSHAASNHARNIVFYGSACAVLASLVGVDAPGLPIFFFFGLAYGRMLELT